MKRYKIFKKVLCLFLAFSIALIQPFYKINASEHDNLDSTEINSIITEYTKNIESNTQAVYNNLTSEAKKIFLQYMISFNPDLYNYHKENVIENTNDILLEKQILQESSYTVYNSSSTSNLLSILESNLNQIANMSKEVFYALMAAGSSILAEIASLGTAKIASILLGAGCLIVLLANWSEVQSNWTEIVDAFKITFKEYFTSTKIKSEFSVAKTRLQQDYLENQRVKSLALSCTTTSSCGRHVDVTQALAVLHHGETLAIYSSHYENIGMIVIGIPNNTKMSISRNLSSTLLVSTDVSLGKLYVLFDTKTLTYFHMHVSLFQDDTPYLREANGLCYQLVPYLAYDFQYDHPKKSLNLPISNNF